MKNYSTVGWKFHSRSTLLIIAGAYKNCESALRSLASSEKFAKESIDLQATLIDRPSGQKPFTYDPQYTHCVVRNAWEYALNGALPPREFSSKSISELRNKTISAWKDDELDIYLKYNFIFVLYRDAENIGEFRLHFHPALYSVLFGNDAKGPRALLKMLDEVVDSHSNISSLLHKQISPNAHRNSPLMLPVVNFDHKTKQSLFQFIFDASDDLGRIKKKIQRSRKDLRDKVSGAFLDRRNLSFQPADERHGDNVIRDDNLEEIRCTLGGCFRFGVPFPSSFHYNVENTRRNTLSLTDCLGNITNLKSNAYINISPNDHLR